MVEMSRRFASLMGCFLLVAAFSAPLAAQEKPPVVAHDLAGKENCMMCHMSCKSCICARDFCVMGGFVYIFAVD